jgi:hypothetical protein
MAMTPYPIPLRRKVFFWIVLGALSTYFAESVAGSTLFPFTTGNGLLLVFPVYCLHVVVLAAIVFRFGQPRFDTLYIAGTIFGMYEAYITKVLWTSSSPDGPLATLGGVSVLDFLVVVLFWHPLMGFVLPVTLGERLLTASRTVRFSRFPGSARGWLIIGTLCGANQGMHSPSPFHSLAAGGISLAVLVGLTKLWKRGEGSNFEFQDLLPSAAQMKALCGILLVLYAIFTFRFRPEKLPGAGPQFTILGTYAVLISLLVFHLRKNRPPVLPVCPEGVSLKLLAAMLGVAAVSSAFFATVLGMLGLKTAVFLLILVLSALVGFAIFVGAVARLFRVPQGGAKVPSAAEAG